MIWKYVKPYLPFAILAGLLMVGEVMMDLIQPGMMSQIVDNGVLGLSNGGVSDMRVIRNIGLQMILLVLIGGLCGSLNNVVSHYTAQNVGNDMRKDCFSGIMSFSFSQLDRFTTGSLVTRTTNDIVQVQSFVSVFFRGLIRMSMLMFGSIICMFRLNRDFGITVLCVLPFLVGCMMLCLYKANPLFVKLQSQLDGVNAILQEDISGIRIIKACVKEAFEKKRFGKANDNLTGIQLSVLIIFAFMDPVVNALMYLVVALILLIGSREIGSGLVTPGTIMAAITYTTQLLSGIHMLMMLFQNISRGYVSWKRVKEVLLTKPEQNNGAFKGKTEQTGEIEFKDVSFAYPGTGRIVLEGLNFSIHKGETVAIMGATGCGKTTLVNLIPRFYDAGSGTVFVDGRDVREYDSKALRSKIAVVSQKAELFAVSIEENLKWGAPDADEESVKTAAAVAQADEFISTLPGGYGTMVAERGSSLSGGQKQRLSIARAVLKNAEILIFDDATSALDLKTEADLYKALQREDPDCTKIIVAQRIASVRHADRIIVLEKGRISAIGTHEELLRRSPIYQDIYYSQAEEGVA